VRTVQAIRSQLESGTEMPVARVAPPVTGTGSGTR
jgi:hypothetical protein